MAVYTLLGADEIAAALRRFGLPAPERVVPERKGYVNSNYHVWAGGERFFLRVAEGKSDDDVLFEAEVLRYLDEARFPVPRLLRATDGRPFVPLAGRPLMLFAYAPGEEIALEAATAERCRRVGEQLARLHDLAAGFTRERPNPYGPARVASWISALRDGAEDPDVAAALPLLEEESARAGALPGAPRGLVHGDLFADNVLWIGDRVSFLLDWEMSCVDAFAYDLGVALCAWCWDAGLVPARAVALAAGYRAKRKVEPETWSALPAWARFAALRFTASRIHALRSPDLGDERQERKDWRPFRDRLVALRELGDAGLLAMLRL